MRKKLLIVATLIIVSVLALMGCEAPITESYTIPMIDLDEQVIKGSNIDDDIIYRFDETVVNDAKYTNMFNHKTIVTDKYDYGKDYMAHPDSVLLRRKKAGKDAFEATNEILTMFPLGHGFGEIKGKISYDGGMSYDIKDEIKGPESFKRSTETPTLYRLTFNKDNIPDDNDLLVVISGNPSWPADARFDRPKMSPNGFNVAISAPSVEENGDTVEGRVWSEFETWYGAGGDAGVDAKYIREPQGFFGAFDAIVAMSSLTRLKETNDAGEKVWTNKWMGLFHDHGFNCYKTILSFEEPTEADINAGYPTYMVEGTPKVMKWSFPEKYFSDYRFLEVKSSMCEVECLRSDGGNGDEIAIITRSNSKRINSLVSFSTDEGATWSTPREVPAALNGERHKAEWVKVNGKNKLFITFRSIERGSKKAEKYGNGSSWMSEGYVAWVGDWDDLKNGTEGDFRVKIAHTYLSGQEETSRSANGDTGYCGNVVLPDGKVATCSYGQFAPTSDANHGNTTYIAGRVIDVSALFDLLAMKDA